MLNKLKEVTGGDKKQMQLHIDSYIDGMTGRVNSLKNALEQENYQGIGNIVMKAKPHFITMGFDDLYRLANHVERSVNKIYSKDMVKEHTRDLINDLEASIEKVKRVKL
ncbi:hypothetical protein [Owenweeksia hongkongensis]|uniref:hypothetical protein n=1 Tax=Owenweeksia hongkongensis TaxID=253245 RepID=UPI003A8F8A76